MKKLFGRRAVAIAAGIMCGALAAGCGKAEEVTTADKEFVYVPEYQEIPLKDGGVGSVNVIGDVIYFVTDVLDEETQMYTQQLGELLIGETEPKFVKLPIPSDAWMSEMQTDTEGNLITVVTTNIYEETGAEGADAEALEGAEEADAESAEETAKETEPSAADETAADEESDTEETEEAEETAGESVETTEEAPETTAIIGGASGPTAVMMTSSVSGMDMDYQEPISQKIEFYKFSTEGEVLDTVDLTEILDENSYVQYTAVDNDGNIYLCLEQKVIVLDKEGKELFQVEVENWINSMFTTKGGEVLLSYYGNERMEIHTIDVAGKKIGEPVEALMAAGRWGNGIYNKGNATDILFSAENDLYTYNMGDAQTQKVLNWIDCDINSDDIRAFAALDDGRILVITNTWNGADNGSTMEMIYLTKKKGSEVPKKKIITFGTMSLSWDVKKQIIDFNKKNQEYRIEIKEYLTDYSAEDAYTLAQEQMNADIMGGNGPDMIDVSGGDMQKYVSKGILEDLYPYMDADEEIKREDYVPSVLKAYEIDGKLYAVSPRFYVQTVLARKADMGERKSITPEELMKITDGLPEDVELYEYASKSSILMNNTMMNMDQYVDWSTGECNFNGEDFIKAMEFANRFETEVDYNSEGPDTHELLRDGKLLMVMGMISSVEEYQMYRGLFGEPITFIGYPTNKESGSFISDADTLLAMNAKSPNKEGVWQFIKSRINKEAFTGNDSRGRFGFPILQSALEEQFKEAMTEEYYEDAEGNKHKQPKTTWGFNNFNMEIYAATEEEVETVRDLINSTDTLYQYDEQINNIIMEESTAFFEGQKSAKDAADIIQNRVQIYVNENR